MNSSIASLCNSIQHKERMELAHIIKRVVKFVKTVTIKKNQNISGISPYTINLSFSGNDIKKIYNDGKNLINDNLSKKEF